MSPQSYLFALLLLLFSWGVNAQESNLRDYKLKLTSDTIQLDSLTVYPGSLKVFCGNNKLNFADYRVNHDKNVLILDTKCSDSLHLIYRVLPYSLAHVYKTRDTSIVYNKQKGNEDLFRITTVNTVEDIFGGRGLNKSGSISRGVTFGNNQDLGVNSTLNLELSGKITPNLNLLASVSDDNLPIQPNGNTNKLQEFDQVFIQIYNDRLKLIAGDFWLYKPDGYFMTYKKRAQGLTIENYWRRDSTVQFKTQVSGALSKGKFQRQIIQGVEGNQGPYRLRGAENEPFIIVLSGTERVYIDGKLLERGQEFDYVIDYNTSEVTFTSRHQITKDSRIVVEFQYSDQNYIRSLFQTSTSYKSKKVDAWFNAYSEQDAKNQTLQQSLSGSEKFLLSNIGDTLDLARISSIDSVGYFSNQNLYRLTDSLGYDSVLVISVDPLAATYRATFEYVGSGNGDYILSNYNALGKVYQWIAPVAGVKQGDYAPSRLIVTPKQRQLVTAGARYRFNPKLSLESELAYSNHDINTFSRFDSKDDQSVAAQMKLIGDIPLGRDSINRWFVRTKVELEARERNFTPIEQYRAVEFDRDWNVRNKPYVGNQLATKAGFDFINKHGNLNVEGQQFLIGTDYNGWRSAFDGRWNQSGFKAVWDGSFLSSDAEKTNQYIRHRADVSQNIGWFKIGYKDDHERNLFSDSILNQTSYEFFDYQFYLANSDSIKNSYRLFYRERIDRRSDSVNLQLAAKARSFGAEMALTELDNQSLKLITSYRELRLVDSNLIQITPENTLLGRVDYELTSWKGAMRINSFYEVGSGLELKKEFLYILVNDGQGVYTWVDYNNDGVKDLNEFEIAQYVDQASYVRVFTPSNEYVKTYSNELSQSFSWRPERIWSQKKGFLKFATRFSDQAQFRIKRKTNYFNGADAFNPFASQVADSNLISLSSNIRNTIYFNRTSNIAGADYTYHNTNSKTLLASGFDSRANVYHELSVRWNIKKQFTLKVSGQKGVKSSLADYTSGRNYELDYVRLEPSFIYQPNTVFRISLDARGSEKLNVISVAQERSQVLEIGTKLKWNQVEKGSFQGSFSVLKISYNGEQNSALGFEMLESLKPGINYTWSALYQRSISRNLQLSFQYNGRKSEDNRMIHSGGMELRAFF